MDGPLRGSNRRPVMSSWEQRQVIEARINCETGELMLSASDVVAWLREHATTIKPAIHRPALATVADHLAGLLFEATRSMLDDDGGES
jgi:hypothetical protein